LKYKAALGIAIPTLLEKRSESLELRTSTRLPAILFCLYLFTLAARVFSKVFRDISNGRGRRRFAALCSVVGISILAILTFHGSHRVRAFAFAVTAAVVALALVDVFAALRSVVGIPSWAIATFRGSRVVGACAFAVAAAVVAGARVRRRVFALPAVPGANLPVVCLRAFFQTALCAFAIFQLQRIRLVCSLPVLTASAEVAAEPAPEERDALALCFIITRLLARREVALLA
jgi:hypothetical protein